MSDDIKELLTLAAKACGHEVYGFYGDDEIETTFADIGPDHVVKFWAPHLDDGDGARMEEKLHLDVLWWEFAVSSGGKPTGVRSYEQYADHNNDRQAARRWASLRAAAETGRQMP